MSADQIEAILADFRAWLQEAADLPAAEPAPGLDVAAVVQQFTALRHEVNLQTKSSRAQLEQNAQTLAMLQESLEPASAPSPDDAADESQRPLLKAMVDAHDALALARREVERLLEQPAASADVPNAREINLRLPYWTRWLGLDASIDAQLAPVRAWIKTQQGAVPPDRQRQALDALLVGYSMSLQRIERALEQHGLETIPCVGEPFDPETMEVAEVVRDPARSGAEVIQELRPGYRWHGKLFRYAQVRVARP